MVLVHLLIALATWWTLAAGKTGTRPALINAIISHDDFNICHFPQSVFDRLVLAARSPIGAGDEELVVRADGHVDSSIWSDRYETPSGIGLKESRLQRRYSFNQDHLSNDTIDSIAGTDQMKLMI